MNWSDFLGVIAARSGVSKADARAVLEAFVDESVARVVSGDAVRVPGFGTFSSQWGGERSVRSIADGRRVPLDGRHCAAFRPSARLRTALRERTPQPLRDPEHQRAWRLAEAR